MTVFDSIWPLLGLLVLATVLHVTTEVRAHRAIRREGRWLSWPEVVERLGKKQGILIVNYGNVIGKIWWIEEVKEDESLAWLLLTRAYLTNCPRELRNTELLKSAFPDSKILECRSTGFVTYRSFWEPRLTR